MGNKASSSASSVASDSSCDFSLSSSDRHSVTASSPPSSRKNKIVPSISISKKFVKGPSPIPENPSPAVRTVLQWIAAKNRHDVMKLYCVTDADAAFYFPDTDVHLPMREFWNAMIDVFEGLPDLSFSYWDIQEIRPGVVRLTDYVGAGHHKGNFRFADLPVLPPTGEFLADEPIELTITVDPESNKITYMEADAKGGLAGPPGFYAKIKMHMDKKKQSKV